MQIKAASLPTPDQAVQSANSQMFLNDPNDLEIETHFFKTKNEVAA
jgi:hypothetical protein